LKGTHLHPTFDSAKEQKWLWEAIVREKAIIRGSKKNTAS
jgi:hypothetical protein